MLTTLLLCATLTLALPPAAGDKLAEARAQIAAGEVDAALATLDAMLTAGEGVERDVRLALADAQLASGRPDVAVETLSPIAADGDHDALLAIGLAFKAYAEHMASLGRPDDDVGFAYDEARSYLSRAAEIAPAGDSRASVAAGNIELYVMGDAQGAYDRADALVKADGTDGEALLLRGCAGLFLSIAESDGGEVQAAEQTRQFAVDDLIAADKNLPKDRVEPWVQLAWLYEVMDRPDDAVRAAATVVRRMPAANFGTLYHLARRYSGEHRFGPASQALAVMAAADKKTLGEWILYDDDRAAAALELSWAVGELFSARRFQQAFEVLGAITMTEPKDADVWNNYALAAREVGNFDESARAYRRALKLDPTNPRFMNDLALVLHYYLKKDLGEAAELYEKAAETASGMLEADDLSAEDRALLEEVARDAKNNLTKLAAGDYEWN